MKFCLKFLKDFYFCFVASHLFKNSACALCGGYERCCYCQAYTILSLLDSSYGITRAFRSLQAGSLGLSVSQSGPPSLVTGWIVASQSRYWEFSVVLMQVRVSPSTVAVLCPPHASECCPNSLQSSILYPFSRGNNRISFLRFQIICPAWPSVRSLLYHRLMLWDLESRRCCFGPGDPVLCEKQLQTQWQSSWYTSFTLFCE